MAAPSTEAVALIVGCATVTIGAMWSAIGYTARRFMDQQRSNHGDTLEALQGIRDIKSQLGPIKMRVDRIEAVGVVAGAALAWFAMRWRQSDKL